MRIDKTDNMHKGREERSHFGPISCFQRLTPKMYIFQREVSIQSKNDIFHDYLQLVILILKNSKVSTSLKLCLASHLPQSGMQEVLGG